MRFSGGSAFVPAPAWWDDTLAVASVIAAIFDGSIFVGSRMSMVPRYAVITWNGGMVPLGSVGFGSEGVCTNAAARKVCFPQARADSVMSARIVLRIMREPPPSLYPRCSVDACDASQYVSDVPAPVREAVGVWAGVIL